MNSQLYLFTNLQTKLDFSFRNSSFEVPGYKLEICDRNARGGEGGRGVAAFKRAEIPTRRSKDIE